MATITYRRERTSSSSSKFTEWHFARRCSKWPDKDYDIAYSKPHTGQICRDCLRLQGWPQKSW
jgi:hypothetical protein